MSDKKIQQLKSLIQNTLTPLISHDYRYLMMCDHQNVGDTLIMKGEFDFLSTIKTVKCKEFTTMWSFEKRRPAIPKDELLIMRGSGSFGDIWPDAPEFWKFVMENYPENPILFMPQTIHFNDKNNLFQAAQLINHHKKITLCLRDKESYNLAKEHFHCKSYLVPDMAIYMNMKNKFTQKQGSILLEKALLVKRNDREYKDCSLIAKLQNNRDVTVSDWPTFSNFGWVERMKNKIREHNLLKLYDTFIRFVYSRYITYQGIKFLTPFNKIYATRMHAAILALMMDKNVVFVNNSYGKLRKVYETWFSKFDKANLEL